MKRVAMIPEEYMEEVRKLQNEQKEIEELNKAQQKEIQNNQSNLLKGWRKEMKKLNREHCNEILDGIANRNPNIVNKRISTSISREIGGKNITVDIQVYENKH